MSIYESTITNPKKQLEFYKDLSEQLQQENKELKEHVEVPETCNLKTLEDYKSHYQDNSKEQILEDTYINYCAYVNLEHKYAKLKKRQKECVEYLEDKIKEYDKTDRPKNVIVANGLFLHSLRYALYTLSKHEEITEVKNK